MAKPIIVPDFMTCSDPALITRSANVLTKMTGNGSFTNPVIALPDLAKQLDLFTHAVTGAQNRDRQKAAEKNAIKVALRAILSQLKIYVEDIANGDEAILLSSGFKVKGTSSPTAELGVFSNFTVKPGRNSGEIILNSGAVNGAVSYGFQFSIENATPVVWQTFGGTRTKKTLTGLPAGTKCVFRMVAYGRNKQEWFSGTISWYVA